MNNLKTTSIFIVFFNFLISCNLLCDDCGGGNGNYPIQATIYFINETSNKIKSTEGCKRDINPNETISFTIKDFLGGKTNVNNFPVSIFNNCSTAYKDGDILKCEYGISNIVNYENKRELEKKGDTLVFEFTFRFTNEKMSRATPCEL